MKKIISLLIFSISSTALIAQELSLDEAIKMGLENNYSVKIIRNSEEISQNNNTLGNAGFLPRLSVNSTKNYTRQDTEQEFSFDPAPRKTNGAKSESFSAGAALTWSIFDGMKMFATKDRLNELERSSQISVDQVIENTILNISLAYYKILLERNRHTVLDSSLTLSKDRLNIAKSKYEVGKASKLEYMSAQVDYNSDLSALLRQEETLQQAKIELNRLLNREITEPIDVSGEIEVDTTLVLNEILQDALTNNTGLNLLKSSIAVSSISLKEIRAERLPVLSLNAGYNYNNLSSQAGVLLANKTEGVTYGLSATWSLFNGFTLNRRLQNAKIAINSGEMMMEDLGLQIKANVHRTYNSYTNNMKLFNLEQENLSVAQENASIALERYKLGNSDALELREAQVQAVQAASRLLDSSYNTKIAELNLWLISGRLLKRTNLP